MRISAGVAKGTTLTVPTGARPTSERVRLSIMSSISAHIEDARVLDLYCGSGAWGLEALSRGAQSAVFVDRDRGSIEAVKQNAVRTKLNAQVITRRADVLTYLLTHRKAEPKATLVFCDPPYASDEITTRLLDAMYRRVEDEGCVVVEFSSRRIAPAAPKGWNVADDRRYGDTRILIYGKETK